MPTWAIILSAIATAGAVYAWSMLLVRYAFGKPDDNRARQIPDPHRPTASDALIRHDERIDGGGR